MNRALWVVTRVGSSWLRHVLNNMEKPSSTTSGSVDMAKIKSKSTNVHAMAHPEAVAIPSSTHISS